MSEGFTHEAFKRAWNSLDKSAQVTIKSLAREWSCSLSAVIRKTKPELWKQILHESQEPHPAEMFYSPEEIKNEN